MFEWPSDHNKLGCTGKKKKKKKKEDFQKTYDLFDFFLNYFLLCADNHLCLTFENSVVIAIKDNS